MERLGTSGGRRLDAFVAANLISFAAWDLLVFLNRNPDTDATAAQLCVSLTRTSSEIERAVVRLSESGLLESHRDGEEVRYHLSPDPAQRADLAALAEAARDRAERLELVRHVMGLISI